MAGPTPEAARDEGLRRFTAGAWEGTARADVTVAPTAASAKAAPLRPAPAEPRKAGRSARGPHDSRGKVLGSNLLWGALHRYRDGAESGDEGPAARDVMDRVVVGALLFLLAVALLGVVLFKLS